ncbi:MAG: hypothetical protein AAF267_11450, partial [Deinococcota bacterium]
MRTRLLIVVLFAHFLMASASVAQESGLTLVDFPYEITDDFSLDQVAVVAYADQQVDVQMDALFIPIYTDGERIEGGRVHLLDVYGSSIALDILHSAQQDKVVFSYENSLRADLLQYLYTSDMPDDLCPEINEYISNHPNYEPLLTLYKTLSSNQSSINADEYGTYYSLSSEIVLGLFKEFFELRFARVYIK